MRLIDSDGKQLGVVTTRDALAKAEEQSLDLVEVNPREKPPVCKIMDFGKHKYELSKKSREGRKARKVQETKEVKYRPQIGKHDFDFKTKHAREFLEAGSKVRLLVQFRGREMVHPETGKAVLDRVCSELADVCSVIQLAKMEGRFMAMMIGPKRNAGKSS